MKLLLIEDDHDIAIFIENGCRQASHTVDIANDGVTGVQKATDHIYDVIIVDRMLPRLDGLGVIRTIRHCGLMTPILILSALGEVDDRVKGLRSGGDDYLVKPFAMSELLARIEVLGRRVASPNPITVLQAGDLSFDLITRKITRAGRNVTLQTREMKLLEYLLRHKGQIVTRSMLLEHVWDYNFDPQTNVIDVHMSRLRNKIGDTGENQIIRTIRGQGYILDDRA
jgi:two-component system, OmpR family, response regulator